MKNNHLTLQLYRGFQLFHVRLLLSYYSVQLCLHQQQLSLLKLTVTVCYRPHIKWQIK